MASNAKLGHLGPTLDELRASMGLTDVHYEDLVKPERPARRHEVTMAESWDGSARGVGWVRASCTCGYASEWFASRTLCLQLVERHRRIHEEP